MPRIVPGQQRARPTSKAERIVDIVRGVPRSRAELKQSLIMLGMYRDVGWQRSVTTGRPVGPDGEPVPWFSYPAIEWLGSVITGRERVFEFGSGNSTVWFSVRVSSVVSVEHDSSWVQEQRPRIASNVTLLERACTGDEDWAPDSDPYVSAIDDYPVGHFDIVLVDGMARNSCVQSAIHRLSQQGSMILDNADRPAHYPGIRALHDAGFARVDFVGPTVVQGVFSSTSVFSRGVPATFAAQSGHPRFWGY